MDKPKITRHVGEHFEWVSIELTPEQKKALSVPRDAWEWFTTPPSERTLIMHLKRFRAKCKKRIDKFINRVMGIRNV